jgi:putative flavoprotein involved in K+ transport
MSSRVTERRDVVIVGGGQAGLAIGRQLARQDRDFTILEAASRPAAAWQDRWDSLTLFTPARYDSLPGQPFPGDPDGYPGRDDVVEYLTDYARDLPVELDSRVTAVRRAGDGYVVELEGGTLEADQVVIATGPFQVPRVPAIAEQLAAPVVQMHSTEYRRPDALPPGPVLVVGGGNTGFQIAAELVETHEVHLAIGSRQTPLPQRVLGRDLFSVLDWLGLIHKSVDSRIGRRMQANEDTLIGSRPRTVRRLGVKLRPRAVGADGATVRFVDGTSMTVSSVIWATGYGLDHSWVDVPVFDADGRLEHKRGVTAARGLYFLGLPWMYTRGSSLLGWVGEDAEYLAGVIAATAGPKRAVTTAPPAGAGKTERVR